MSRAEYTAGVHRFRSLPSTRSRRLALHRFRICSHLRRISPGVGSPSLRPCPFRFATIFSLLCRAFAVSADQRGLHALCHGRRIAHSTRKARLIPANRASITRTITPPRGKMPHGFSRFQRLLCLVGSWRKYSWSMPKRVACSCFNFRGCSKKASVATAKNSALLVVP